MSVRAGLSGSIGTSQKMEKWIPEKTHWLGPRPKQRRKAGKKDVDRMYSVQDVAQLMSVSKRTVMKWLSVDEPEFAVIPPEGWIKLQNGYIRIREWAVILLQQKEI